MFHRASVARDSFDSTSPRSSHSPSLPPSPNLSLSSRRGRALYQHPSGSRFLEEAVSAVFTETGTDARTVRSAGTGDAGSGAGTSVEVEVIPATLPSSLNRLRTQPSRLQKARRVTPVSIVRTEERVRDSGSEDSSSTWTMTSLPMAALSPPPVPSGPLSFCPAPHPAESFTEYDRLQVRLGEFPALVLLHAVAPSQSTRCTALVHTSLPPERDAVRDMIPRHNGFVETVLEAYGNHRGLVVRADDVWLAIVTQFRFFVRGHGEALARVFSAHEGVVVVETDGMDAAGMVHHLTAMLDEQLADRTLCEWVMPDFTTTTLVDKAACAVAMMGTTDDASTTPSALHGGIPKVTLEGEKKDWETILQRIERLKTYGLPTIAWYHLLRPVLTRIVSAYARPDHADNVAFWNQVARADEGQLSGWITAFCAFDARGQWQGDALNEERVREHEPRKLLRRADPLQLTPARFASVYTVRARAPYLALDGVPYPTIRGVPCGHACMDVWLSDNEGGLIVAGAVSRICSTEATELFRNGMRDTVRPVSAWWCLVKRRRWEEGSEGASARTSVFSSMH